MRNKFRGHEGQALVEFAFVLPILLALVFGIAEFALALNKQGDATHIASEVARYATVNENPGAGEGKTLARWGIEQFHNEALQNKQKSRLCISFPGNGNEATQPVKVEIKSTVVWLPIPKFEPSTKLVGSAVMRLEVHPTHYEAECYES
jgi:Flp pilus assembly protein TadG